MKRVGAEGTGAALRPIASLISKSDKAMRRLAPDTWQHAMLRGHLKALRLASALIKEGGDAADRWTRDDLDEARQAVAAMIRKAEQARSGFAPGTSHHTLQQNRVKALRAAMKFLKSASGRPRPGKELDHDERSDRPPRRRPVHRDRRDAHV